MSRRVLTAILASLTVAAVTAVLIVDSDNGQSRPRVTSLQERAAVRLERRRVEDPRDQALQLRTMRAWIRAGADELEDLAFSDRPIPRRVTTNYEAGLRVWNDYLQRAGGRASRDAAETAGVTYFQLVEIGTVLPPKATERTAGAVRAQKIVCAHDPTLHSLSELAIYQYFNGEYAAGDRAARAAAAKATTPLKPIDVIGQLNEYKERGEKFVTRVKRGEREIEETGEEELEAPVKGYGSPAGINGYEP